MSNSDIGPMLLIIIFVLTTVGMPINNKLLKGKINIFAKLNAFNNNYYCQTQQLLTLQNECLDGKVLSHFAGCRRLILFFSQSDLIYFIIDGL